MYVYRPVLLEGCASGGTCLELGTGVPLQLPGFGVELAIKNMEYSALDDSKVSHLKDPYPLLVCFASTVRLLLSACCAEVYITRGTRRLLPGRRGSRYSKTVIPQDLVSRLPAHVCMRY